MGFLGALGKGLGMAAGIGGAPFTGGASLAAVLPSILDVGGSVIGGMAKGSADSRAAENTANTYRDRNLIDLYGTQQRAITELAALQEKGLLDRAKLGIEAPGARTAQLARASLLSNLKP